MGLHRVRHDWVTHTPTHTHTHTRVWGYLNTFDAKGTITDAFQIIILNDFSVGGPGTKCMSSALFGWRSPAPGPPPASMERLLSSWLKPLSLWWPLHFASSENPLEAKLTWISHWNSLNSFFFFLIYKWHGKKCSINWICFAGHNHELMTSS